MGLITRALKPITEPIVKRRLEENIRELVQKGAIKPGDPAFLQFLKADAYRGMPYNSASPQKPGTVRYSQDFSNMGDQMRRKPASNVSFQILREFSTTYEIARACINARKRQLTSLEWEIVPMDQGDALQQKEDAKKYASEIDLVKKFFDDLGGHRVRFRSFLDMIIEDMLVLDAIALLRNKTVGDDLLYLTPIDASTIKIVVDKFGNIPEPPATAYKQIIRGAITAELTTDDLIYDMMNPRSSTPYGLAPIESLILVVSSALRSEVYNLNYLTDGNIPEGLFAVPESWGPQQIKEYQEVWDAYISGDPRQGSRLRFTPGGAGVGYTATKKPDDMRFKEFQEWLMLCTCAMFDIQPQELGFTMHQSTRANANQQANIQSKKGIQPLANFMTELFRNIIHDDLGFPELDFVFRGIEDHDKLQEAQAKQVEIQSGYKTVDEIRKDEGLDPIGIDEPFVIGQPSFLPAALEDSKLPAQPVTISGAKPQQAQTNTGASADKPADSGGGVTTDIATADSGNSMNQKSLKDEMRTFQTFAVNRKIDKKGYRPFVSKVIEPEILEELNTKISLATSVDEIRKIFRTLPVSPYSLEKVTRVNFPLEAWRNQKDYRSFHKQLKGAVSSQVDDLANKYAKHGDDRLRASNPESSAYLKHWLTMNRQPLKKFLDVAPLSEYLKKTFEYSAKTNYQREGIIAKGVDFNLTNVDYLNAIRDRANYLLNKSSIDDTTFDELYGLISDGLDEGLTPFEVGETLKANVDDISDTRANVIALTETANAMGDANVAWMQQNGVETKKWVTAGPNPCEICIGNEDQGDIPVDAEFDSGDDSEPGHPNCECYTEGTQLDINSIPESELWNGS